jgi:hypothetical protein
MCDVKAAHQALSAKIEQDVKRDFGLDQALINREILREKHAEGIQNLRLKFQEDHAALKLKMQQLETVNQEKINKAIEIRDKEVLEFDKKIGAAYGAAFVPHDDSACGPSGYITLAGNNSLGARHEHSVIAREVENRLAKQNGSVKKLEDAFEDAVESLWTADAPENFQEILDGIKAEAETILLSAEKKAPALPAPKKPAIAKKKAKKKKK